jgi:hypothetical protein
MVWDWSRISGAVLVTGNPGGKLLPEQNGPRHGASVGDKGLPGHLLHGEDSDRLDGCATDEEVDRGLPESGLDSKT